MPMQSRRLFRLLDRQKFPLMQGDLMLKRIRELVDKREDFAFETTRAARSFAPFLMGCKRTGYLIHILYIWLQSPELAVARVAQRVESGGHFVPEITIRNRYSRGLSNFFELYMPIADTWTFYDNSFENIRLVAEKAKGAINVISPEIWATITEDSV